MAWLVGANSVSRYPGTLCRLCAIGQVPGTASPSHHLPWSPLEVPRRPIWPGQDTGPFLSLSSLPFFSLSFFPSLMSCTLIPLGSARILLLGSSSVDCRSLFSPPSAPRGHHLPGTSYYCTQVPRYSPPLITSTTATNTRYPPPLPPLLRPPPRRLLRIFFLPFVSVHALDLAAPLMHRRHCI